MARPLEVRLKISETMKGQRKSETHKRRISQAHIGKIVSKQSRENMSKAHRCKWLILCEETQETIIVDNLSQWCEENKILRPSLQTNYYKKCKTFYKGYKILSKVEE